MSNQSVGKILRKAREDKGLTLEQAKVETKIHQKFLKALEDGDYSLFSSSVHIKGFLRNYADFLGLNVPSILAFWRREFDEDLLKRKGSTFPRPLSRSFLITPGFLVSIFTGGIVLMFLLYLILAYKTATIAPKIVIDHPSANFSTNEGLLDISGKVDADATLYLNGQKVSTLPTGKFTQKITLSPGENTLGFRAVSKLGKESTLSRTVYFIFSQSNFDLESSSSEAVPTEVD